MRDMPSPTLAGILDKVRGLEPLVAEHRAAFDRDRRLPDALFRAMAEADLFRLWIPRDLGGPELSPLEFMTVVEAAAALDASVAWVIGNGAGMSRVAGYVPEAVARAWFADSSAFIAASTGAVGTATPVDGGYLVSGRWIFGSGIHHASLVMGLCAAPQPAGPPAPFCCFFPAKAATIVDNWHVSGLRGTGSCDFTVENLFVPAAHTCPFVAPTATRPGLLYRMPHVSVFAITVSVVPLGIARAAISAFVELATSRVREGASGAPRERETIQAEVGRAEARHRSARAFLVESIGELMLATDAGGERLIHARALFRVACANAAESAVRVVGMMAAAAGAEALRETCPLERMVRDVHAAVKHVAMSPNNYVVAGRIGLGLDPGTTRF